MHSFEYEDAREAFVEAQKADPGFAMAYWGEAMTFNHAGVAAHVSRSREGGPRQARGDSRCATRQGADRKGKGLARRGREIVRTGEKLARDLAYADAMKRMHDKYPADDEVTSFYALAILGTSHGGRDFSIYMRAAALVEQVYAKNPQHPAPRIT